MEETEDDEEDGEVEVVMLRDVPGGANTSKRGSKNKEETEAADAKADAARAGAVAAGGKRVSMAGPPSSVGGSAAAGVGAGDLLVPARSGLLRSEVVQQLFSWIKGAGG